jgi:hypothetical protein
LNSFKFIIFMFNLFSINNFFHSST